MQDMSACWLSSDTFNGTTMPIIIVYKINDTKRTILK